MTMLAIKAIFRGVMSMKRSHGWLLKVYPTFSVGKGIVDAGNKENVARKSTSRTPTPLEF